ncbi:hypothetical protein [Thaumasiovibrio subtropicus]|uniref:hypothetical protein n=1 Tax=Thaumasiovibrio subtropicus TaxID=1891207 RepID=UPI00131A748D|nr:hypothetical protein [Thaumasiovibrio subtropicus]
MFEKKLKKMLQSTRSHWVNTLVTNYGFDTAHDWQSLGYESRQEMLCDVYAQRLVAK